MGEILRGAVAVILVGLIIYLVLRWEKVKRPKFLLWLGLGGIKLMILSALFMLGRSDGGWHTFGEVVFILGLLTAFGGAFGGCYPGVLPVWDSIGNDVAAELKQTLAGPPTNTTQQNDGGQGA